MAEDDEILYECGVDLNSNLTFSDGDINLISYEDNLVQSVINRLNTDLDELELFYDDYGSVIRGFLGWKTTNDTLRYIQAEVDNVLLNESRIVAHESEIKYDGQGQVIIRLVLYTSSMVGVPANLVLGKTGVIELDDDEIPVEVE